MADVFAPDASLIELTDSYCARRTRGGSQARSSKVLEKLRKIINNHVGVIELADDLDIETVTEIFIRVNSAGAELSQADFAMSKIAVNETYGGNLLRKAIDYFCHLAVAPEFLTRIEKGDKAFAASEFLPQDALAEGRQRRHLRPDLHRHAARGVHLGVRARQAAGPRGAALGPQLRDQAVRGGDRRGVVRPAEEGHPGLHQQDALRPHHDDPALGGLRDERPDRRPNAVNFAYILYLRGRAEKHAAADLERLVRRWYAMSILRGRYTGSPETAFDFDIRQIEAHGLVTYAESVIENELPESFRAAAEV